MSLPTEPAVALMLAEGVPADALRLAGETLRSFGLRAIDTSGAIAGLADVAAKENWRAVIVASADAQLPTAVAEALSLPVIRVPVASATASGLALLYTAEGDLPAAGNEGGTFATVAIGQAGAKNAALFVVSVLALEDDRLRAAWEQFRTAQTDAVLQQGPPALA